MYAKLLASLPDIPVSKVQIGLNWTAVVVEKQGQPTCGLASTLAGAHEHGSEPEIPSPGELESIPALELAGWIRSGIPLRRSLGCAAINALLPRRPETWIEQNADEVLLKQGRGKKVALVGHFPFVAQLRNELDDLHVLELNPSGLDLPSSSAPRVLPTADLVAITGMAFINQTLPGLLELCRNDAYIMILGPSTPLSPIWAEYGVKLLAGAVVDDILPVLDAIGQGANFRQLHQAGVRLVTQKIT